MTSNCPLCSSQQSSLFDRRNFRDHLVTNRICNACGLVFQSPHMSEEELASYYERQYRIEYQEAEEPNQKDLATQYGRAKSLTQFLQDRQVTITSHLDIGCSAGILLQQIHSTYHCQSIGIEPGYAYRKYAQDHGWKVYESIGDLEKAKEKRFDIITMAHVLEHLPDPIEYLIHLRTTLLEKEGYILIEVPNLYAHNCFETAHLVSYSAHTLNQTLQKAGFMVVALEAHGHPRSAVIPLYLRLLAQPDKKAGPSEYRVVPEGRVALKRKLGMLRRKILTRLMPAKAWQQPGNIQ